MNDVTLTKVRRLISDASVPPSGPTAKRPTVDIVGFIWFDTDLDQPIWWTGTKWVDAMGGDV